jgi:hypothetical protein
MLHWQVHCTYALSTHCSHRSYSLLCAGSSGKFLCGSTPCIADLSSCEELLQVGPTPRLQSQLAHHLLALTCTSAHRHPKRLLQIPPRGGMAQRHASPPRVRRCPQHSSGAYPRRLLNAQHLCLAFTRFILIQLSPVPSCCVSGSSFVLVRSSLHAACC